jgi:hypothetical protein
MLSDNEREALKKLLESENKQNQNKEVIAQLIELKENIESDMSKMSKLLHKLIDEKKEPTKQLSEDLDALVSGLIDLIFVKDETAQVTVADYKNALRNIITGNQGIREKCNAFKFSLSPKNEGYQEFVRRVESISTVKRGLSGKKILLGISINPRYADHHDAE